MPRFLARLNRGRLTPFGHSELPLQGDLEAQAQDDKEGLVGVVGGVEQQLKIRAKARVL